MNKRILQIVDVAILILFLVVAFLISFVHSPSDKFPKDWDCSNTAAYVFKAEKYVGHEPTLVIGYNWNDYWGHAWVEDKEGNVIHGGEKKWLYSTCSKRHYYKEIPKRDPYGGNWSIGEWDTTI